MRGLAILVAVAAGASGASAPNAPAALGGDALLVGGCIRADHGYRSVFHRLRADGTAVRRLRIFPPLAAPFECAERYPSWAPDGRRFIYIRGGAPVVGTVGRSRATDRAITPSGLWPAWSPRGDRIAFVLPVAENLVSLAVVGINGGRVRELVRSDFGIEWPSWSPDGRHILYSTNDVRQPGQIQMWRIRSAGGRPRPLGRGRSPDQSPDGSRIAFITGDDLWTMRPDGTGRRRFVNHRSDSLTWRLAWSADGRRIAYVHYPERSAPSQIRLVRRDGRGRARVKLPRRVGNPSYVHWGSG
jgi:Tol biopolymer transport system component